LSVDALPDKTLKQHSTRFVIILTHNNYRQKIRKAGSADPSRDIWRRKYFE